MNTYFRWDGSPEMFTIPAIELPFSLSIVGLVLGFVLWSFIPTQPKAGKKRGSKESTEPAWILWAKRIGLVVGAQIIGLSLGITVTESIGPISIRWYGLLFASSFIVGYQVGSKMFKAGGFTLQQIDGLLTYMLISTVVGARLGHCLFYDPVYYLSNPITILKVWEGGLASHGAAIGILLGMYLFHKKNPKYSFFWIADRVIILVAIGTAFIRLGNFFNSEIIGHVTDVPWAIIFESKDALPRHATMLYESISYALGVLIFWKVYKRYDGKPPEGLLFSLFFMYMFAARFLMEFTKTRQAAFADDWFLSVGQWLSIPFFLYGVWLFYSRKETFFKTK